MHFLCLLGGCRFAGTDSPYGFVSENQFAELFFRKVEQRLFDLRFHYFEMSTCFTFCQYFSDAENGGQPIGECQQYLFFQDFGRFVIIGTAFAVTDNHVFGPCRCNHFGRNFTRISTFGFIGTILCGYANRSCIDGVHHARQMNKRWRNDHVTIDSFVF